MFLLADDARWCAECGIGLALIDMTDRKTNEADPIIFEIDGLLEFDQGDVVVQSSIFIEFRVQYDASGLADKLFLSSFMVTHCERVEWNGMMTVVFKTVCSR